MRSVTTLVPVRDYDSGGLVAHREWFIPPAYQAFVDVLLLRAGLVPMGALMPLTAENERKAGEVK